MELYTIKNNDNLNKDKDNVYIVADENDNEYKIINPQFYAKDIKTGETLFHFPLKIGTFPRKQLSSKEE